MLGVSVKIEVHGVSVQDLAKEYIIIQGMETEVLRSKSMYIHCTCILTKHSN